MSEKFTTADIARTLAVSENIYLKLVDVDVSGYSMGEDFYNFIFFLYSADSLRTDEDIIVQ